MMIRAEAESRQTDSNSNAWKWEIRKRIWDLMERENIAQNPHPIHHRIPIFVGVSAAIQMVSVSLLHS
jgi:5-formyltetrahydrofolate cyclo-ligase